jgi:hypothetical protein
MQLALKKFHPLAILSLGIAIGALIVTAAFYYQGGEYLENQSIRGTMQNSQSIKSFGNPQPMKNGFGNPQPMKSGFGNPQPMKGY